MPVDRTDGPEPTEEQGYALGLGICTEPEGTHFKILRLVPPGATVLELGCATGLFSELLREQGCSVFGVEIDEDAAQMAGRHCSDVVVGDLDVLTGLPWSEDSFDVVLCMDVLEHLKNPRRLLHMVRRYLKDTGKLVVSVPNVANYGVRLMLLRGKFEYVDHGILDSTHVRFFTLQSIERLLREAGFEITARDQTPGLGNSRLYQVVLGRLLRLLRLERPLASLLSRLFPRLFAYQFIISARPSQFPTDTE